MTINPNKPFVTGVALTESEREIVDEESARLGLYNFSATVRLMIQWYKRNRHLLPLVDHVTQEEKSIETEQ